MWSNWKDGTETRASDHGRNLGQRRPVQVAHVVTIGDTTVWRAAQLVLSPLAPESESDGSECCDAANLCSIAFSRNQKRTRKSLVCLIRSLRTVTSLSIAAASVLSRRSVSIWFGPAFKICFIISNVLTDLGTLSQIRTVSLLILPCTRRLQIVLHDRLKLAEIALSESKKVASPD
jgi:hypothetical protein